MGILDIKQANEEYKKNAPVGNWIPELRLGDGDLAHVVFLTTGREGDDRIDNALIHELDVRPGAYNVEYCIGEDCQYCDGKIPRKRYFGVWVFVQEVFYKTKPKRKDDLQLVEVNGIQYYYEPAKAIWFWRSKYGNQEYIWNQIIENWENNARTLMNRVYRITRRGKDMNTTNYTILATNNMVDEAYCQKYGLDMNLANSLPDAKDVFKKRVAHENGVFKVVDKVVSLAENNTAVKKMDSFNDDPFAGMDVSPVKTKEPIGNINQRVIEDFPDAASVQVEATKEVDTPSDDVVIQSEGEIPTALAEIRKRFKA